MSYQHVLVRRALEGEPNHRLMQTDVQTVSPKLTIQHLVEDYVYRHHHKMFPATDNGRLLGCVTIADIKDVPRSEWPVRTVGDVLHPCGAQNTIGPDADAMQALSRGGHSTAFLHRGTLLPPFELNSHSMAYRAA
jgi:CBS-domain-containing membrane protein